MTASNDGPVDVTGPPAPPTGYLSSTRSSLAFVVITGAIVLAVAGGALWWVNGGPAESPDALYARIGDTKHAAVLHVWLMEDTVRTVSVGLVGSATDQDARDVWCDVIGQGAIDWHVSVSVETDDSFWPAPAHCSDPADVPAGD